MSSMDQELELKPVVISNEMVKPSLPQSSHPPTFTLSLLDQIFPAFHIPVLLFYTGIAPTPPTPHGGSGVDVGGLKASLSQTLDQFYPLAGRFLDDSTICCNDQGLPFIVTQVNNSLSDVLNSPHKLKLLAKLLPPQELQALGPRPISELVPLPIQVNVFLCGGVVIGCYMLHKLLDAASLGTFFNHWSALATKRVDNLIQPDYEATFQAFPPLPEGVERVYVPNLCNKPPAGQSYDVVTVVKSFLFSPASLSNLRAKAASELVPRPTRFEALAGFIWEQMVLAAAAAATRHSQQNTHTTMLSFSVNMRPRMNPPLPKESMGNVVTNIEASQTDAARQRCSLQELVQEIHTTLSNINHKITQVYQGEHGVEALCRERKAESQGVMKYHKGLHYQLSSWCNNGLDEAEFGFGKPSWILPIDGRPLPATLRNFIFFTDYRNPITAENGIEAWLLMDEKEMQVLESSPHFLSFALAN